MKVNKYIRVEKTQQDTKQQEKEDGDRFKERKGNNNNFQKNDRRDDSRRGYGRNKQYTTLNANRADILMKIKNRMTAPFARIKSWERDR